MRDFKEDLSHEILPTNVRGLPSNKRLSDIGIINAFLSDTYVKIKNTGDTFVVDIHQRLKGGANIFNPEEDSDKLWPGGIVPFEIDSTQSARESATVLQAIKEWNESNTGFQLVRRDGEFDYLIFREADGSCSSNVGRTGGGQYIRCDLEGGGFNKGSIKHEIGHAIGFYHEHQRRDRDQYVKVTSNDRSNYGRRGMAYGDYDFNSIMHYSFSQQLQPKPSVRRGSVQNVGQRVGLSAGDLSASRYLSTYAKKQPHSSNASTLWKDSSRSASERRGDESFYTSDVEPGCDPGCLIL